MFIPRGLLPEVMHYVDFWCDVCGADAGEECKCPLIQVGEGRELDEWIANELEELL